MEVHKIPIANFFIGQKLIWESPLSSGEVIGRLDELPSHRLFGSGGKLVTARVSGHKFTMKCAGFSGIGMSGNSFEHTAYGKVERTPMGSRVVVRFRLNIFVFLFLLIWCLGAFLGSLTILTYSLYHLLTGRGNVQNLEIGIPFSVVFPVGAYLMFSLFRKMAAKNEAKVVETLAKVLEEPKAN